MSFLLVSSLLLFFPVVLCSVVYNVDLASLSSTESYQASIITGLWNKQILHQSDTDIGKYDTIYLNRNTNDPDWLQTSFDYYIEATNSIPPTVKSATIDIISDLAVNKSIVINRILFDPSESASIPLLTMLCNEYNALPVINDSDYSNLPIVYDIRGKFMNEYETTLYSFNRYLNTSNSSGLILNKTILSLQKPDLLLDGFLTDFIVSNNLYIFWMSKLCLNSSENELFNDIILCDYYTMNENISVSVMGYYSNNEVVSDCIKTHSPISFVSDFVVSLSYHQLLPSFINDLPYKYLTQINYNKNIIYNESNIYLALIQSDGDNIQLDMNGIRDRMVERISLCNPQNRTNNICPIFGWTISNRLINLAPHIIYWFYNQSYHITNVDSFLMGPSGYGYLYPSRIRPENLQDSFISNTIYNGYLCQMLGTVYWDYLGTPKGMNDYLLKYDNYNYSSIHNGIINDTNFKFNAFFSPSPLVKKKIGDYIYTFEMSFGWHSNMSPNSVAKILNRILIPGTLTYLYKIWDVNFNEVEQMVKLLNDNIKLVDYREMIVLANQKRSLKQL